MVDCAVHPYLPGLDRVPHPEPLLSTSRAHATVHPTSDGCFTERPNCQAIYKLHGSSNWFTADGKRLLIMGGAKHQEIGRHPILTWYKQRFETLLSQPNSRLMVIGYGFRDEHVNQAFATWGSHLGAERRRQSGSAFHSIANIFRSYTIAAAMVTSTAEAMRTLKMR